MNKIVILTNEFFFFLGGGGIMTNGLKQSLTRECCKRILDYGLKW